jgi:carboxyl-terminal processing protease
MHARFTALWIRLPMLAAAFGLLVSLPVAKAQDEATPPTIKVDEVKPEAKSADEEKPVDSDRKATEGAVSPKDGKAKKPALDAATRKKMEEEYFELYLSLADTLDQVERNYVKPIDRRELMEAAIKGMLSKLDPYSSYIPPEEISGFRTSVESQFGGVGIQIAIDGGQLKVISPLVGTPAYRAGVQAGDRITKIEGETTRNLTLEDAVKKLKGEIGTSVTLTVQHPFSGKEDTVTLTRETVHVDTVLGDSRNKDDSWNYMLDPDKKIGYIRLTAFSRDTDTDLKKALEQLKQQKVRGLVLDLRFNPGGLLGSAVAVSDLFVKDGRIVSTKGRNTEERVWDAVKGWKFENVPMVVLANRYSASASEIVAACLQDHDRAVVIGERTWGKGSVQNVVELEAGQSALKLTTATYTRPNGHNIHRFPDAKETDEWGVKPNDGLEVKLSNSEMGDLLLHRRDRDIVPAKQGLDAKKADVVEDKPAEGKSAKDVETATKEPPAKGGVTRDGTGKEGETKDNEKKADSAAPKSTSEKSSMDKTKFTDRQLQKALNYLSTELARAK